MAASTAIPRPPTYTTSLPHSAMPHSTMPHSSMPTPLKNAPTRRRKSSISSPTITMLAHPSRPGSSASTASSRIAGPRISSAMGSGIKTPTSSSTRSVSSGLATKSPARSSGLPSTSASTSSLRKKVSMGVFPQQLPSGSIAAQRAASYSTTAFESSQYRSPTANSSSRPSISGSSRSGSRIGHSRPSLPRTPSLANSSVKGSDYAIPSPITSPTTITSAVTSPVKRSGSESDLTNGKESKGNVIVSVRVRPDVGASHESTKSDVEWMVDGRRALIGYRGREGGEFTYDNVFAAHDANARVYDSAAKRLVRRVMEGYHGTVFAYGMTGTGKTFSMQGTATSPGVIPLAITDIFAFIRETPHREFLLRVSYLEIYNEKIYDLLSAVPGTIAATAGQEEIKLREDSRRGVYASPLKEEIVQSPTQLLRVIARGDCARRTAGTQFNARSSRSHAVVQIVVESRERAGSGVHEHKRSGIVPGGVRVSTLSLIDLAGSERAAENKERRTEGAHINKSLLTLGTVISKLSSDKEGKDAGKHLPYRDSKLTRLLQPALSGNSLVSILCTIHLATGASGSQTQINETLNTMKFASRAKNNIVSHAKKSEEASPGDPGSRALLDRYRTEITDLRRQLEEQKDLSNKDSSGRRSSAQRNSANGIDDDIIDPERERERMRREDEENQRRHEEQMLEMQLARTALKERIEHLNRLILSSKSLGVNTSLPFDRSPSGLSLRNHSALGITSNHSVGLGISRGTYSRLSGASLDLTNIRSPSAMDSYYVNSPSIQSSGFPTPQSGSTAEHSPRPFNSSRPISSSPSLDSLGSNGDGTASLGIQVRALQADLSDRNRYIDTLERRLLHARRSSQSKALSLSFGTPTICPSCREGAVNGVENILREKDEEIRDLKARLDDKERMCNVLRSAARRGLAIDTLTSNHSNSSLATLNTSSPPNIPLPPLTLNRDSVSSLTSLSGRRTSGTSAYRSPKPVARSVTGAPLNKKVYFPPTGASQSDSSPRSLSPSRISVRKSSVAFANEYSGGDSTRTQSVDEMTKLLDQMITDRRRANVTSTASLPSPLTFRTSTSSNPSSKSGSQLNGISIYRPTSLPVIIDTTSAKEDRVDSGIVMDALV